MSRQDLLGIALIALLLSFLGTMGALAYYLGNAEPSDPETLCPTDRSVPHTVLLVDRTDPLTEEHTALVLKTIERVKTSLRVDERFSLFLIEGGAPVVPTPVFSLCKPADGSEANPLYENKRLLGLAYAKGFGDPLSLVVETLEESAQAVTSPIMETIRQIALRPDFAPSVGERKLIIVSDLLQNVPAYSHYRSAPDIASFQKLPYATTVRPDLSGVVIDLVYLRNPNARARQGEEHLAFWIEYLTLAGASSVSQALP